jgi:N-formylglutamate deformylase
MSFTLTSGHTPLLVSMPHVGTEIPADLQSRFVPRALEVEDTDWHLPLLHDFLAELGASVLQPRYSRYVIDLNRPPDDAPMYPGASNTELCPTRFFTGDALYQDGASPDANERQQRREQYWQPYHQALGGELARLRAQHGYALLWDAHSIRSQIPWLFEGTLPDLNIGTASGASADATVAQAVQGACVQQGGYSHVLNGRFKGGFITRHYGAPQEKIHAVQLEMCQSTYMQEHRPFAFDAGRAAGVRPVIRAMMSQAMQACQVLHG